MRFKWTPERLDKLRELYVDTHIDEICKYFGVKRHVVYCACDRYKIKRTEEFLNKYIYTIQTNPETQFKKGQPAWNKGMKGIDIGGKETRFKKGQKAHNWKPDGSERINKDGYIDIKHNGKFKPKHRLIYEQHHGVTLNPLDVVIFLDRNNRNFEISNLKLITREEHMNRNHWINLPPELQEVIHLKKTITKLITEHGKKQN